MYIQYSMTDVSKRKLLKSYVNVSFNSFWQFNDFQPQSDLSGLIKILVLVFGVEPPLLSKQPQLDQSLTSRPYPISSPYPTLPYPNLPYPGNFRYPVSTSQFANSGPGQYHVSSPQYDTSEAKTPASMEGKFECTKHSVLKHVHVGIYVWELWYYHPWYNYASIINKCRF